MVDNMLFLANQGIDVIRIDAVPYIWKQLGTNCRNLREVHTIVRMIRMITEIVCPGTLLLGEVVMSPDKLAPYFGTTEKPECHMLYNATTMCTTWNTVATRDVRLLRNQLDQVNALPREYIFLNYLRCHDDIGWAITDEDAAALLAAKHLVSARGPDAVEVDLVELELAAAAAAPGQRRCPDPARGPDLVVEVHEVLSRPGDQVGPWGGHRSGLGVELGQAGVPPLLETGDPLPQLAATAVQLADVGLGGLGPLHDLELDLLELTLTPRERLELVLQGLQVLGGAGAGVEAGAVARGPVAHELDVGLGLGDLALDVAELGAGPDQLVVDEAGLVVEVGELDQLRQVAARVGDLGQPGVDGLQVEQAELTLGSGFHGIPPMGFLERVVVGPAGLEPTTSTV